MNYSIVNRTGLHWHETHTEYLRVSSGKAFVTIDGKTTIVDTSSGELCVPIGVVHEWGVAEENNDNDELVIWERTEPVDGLKEIFFRNLISSLLDSSLGNPFSSESIHRRLAIRDVLQFFVIFQSLDNYPVFWNGIGKRYVTYSFLFIGNLLGRFLFGLKPFYIEYTPEWFYEKQKLKSQ